MARDTVQVIVIGGGLAGMAAAAALHDAGLHVTLLEARKTLGGRAGSFRDPITDEVLDNCQHVLLGCCTNLLDFYRRLGVANQIRFEKAIHFLDGAGRSFNLFGVPGLPAPLHLGPAFLGFAALTWAERVALSRAMLAMMRLGRLGRQQFDDLPFGVWLEQYRQPASLIHKLYDPVLISALNEETRTVSSSYAIQVFVDSLLANSAGYPVGLPACPLSELYAGLPCDDVQTGTRVLGLEFDGNGRCQGVRLAENKALPADAVVLAINHHTLPKWIPNELARRDERFAHLDRLESVPILGAHLWFDRPVLHTSHAALIEGPLQWLFRKDASGTAVHGVISAARDWVDRSKEQSLALFEKQVRATLKGARDARLVRGVIVIEKRATFSVRPGLERFRPAQEPPLGGMSNVYLAGDYTRTGWPATMEGAVRSGYLAAGAVMRSLQPGWSGGFLVPDLPPQWPARFIQSEARPF
jgi:squalene-associated FAD-dependent desaturase